MGLPGTKINHNFLYQIYETLQLHHSTNLITIYENRQMSLKQDQHAPTQRFSNRVENYIRYRPGYPDEVLQILEKETGLTPSSIIADIGSGTGISTELFLKNGNMVYAVEPNDAMREAAELLLKNYPNFHSVNGTSEATTIDGHCIDLVIAAQAFHWFTPDETRREFDRILKPNGNIVLMWNRRKENETLFLASYEALLQQYGTDYDQVRHTNIDDRLLGTFFESYKKHVVYNEQLFDFDGLKGRLLSSSYAPTEGHPNYEPMIKQLKIMFHEYQQNGQVRFEYDTEIYIGQVSSEQGIILNFEL